MSDPQIPPVAAAKGGSGRGLRWALAVSVALNLAVAGGMIGAAINVGGIDAAIRLIIGDDKGSP